MITGMKTAMKTAMTEGARSRQHLIAWRCLAILAVMALALFAGSHAVQGQQEASAQLAPSINRINTVRTELDKAETTLREYWQTEGELVALKSEIDSLAPALRAAQDELQPQLEAARKRLAQLGAKPGEKDPAEPEEVARQRAELTKAADTIDALVRQASLQSLRIQQLSVTIINQRRELLLRQIFQRSYSALNPALWMEAARTIPGNIQNAGYVTGGWRQIFASQLSGSRLWQFLALVAVLIAAYFPLRRIAERVIARQVRMSEPPLLHKAVAAIWITLVFAVVPVSIAMLIAECPRLFGVVSPGLQSFTGSLVAAVQAIAITVGLSRGLLSPGKPEWRLLDISDGLARRLALLAITAVSLLMAMRVFETVSDVIGAPLVTSVALRVLGTCAVAAVIAFAFYKSAEERRDLDCEFGPLVERKRDWLNIWRMLAGVTIVAIIGANIFGYINFANFAVSQIVWITFLMIATYLALTLVREAAAAYLLQDTAFGKTAMQILGVRDSSLKQAGVLLQGVATILIYIIAGMLALAPWGVESDSLAETIRAVFGGFSLGAINFSLSALAVAIALFALGYLATRAFQRWLDSAYLPNTEFDSGLRNSIVTSAGYAGVIAACTLPFAYLGFNFEKLALVAGALSLGIGFGLQSIVSNFVSGLILLWERTIKVGDWVVVGEDQGIVRRINVRSTEIETFDRQMVILPNSNLISGVVKNWVRGDRLGRITIAVGVGYGSDPHRVRELLLECAANIPVVLAEPPPSVLFTDFGESALNFELRCFVADVNTSGQARSDLRFEILRMFRDAGVEIPFPQREVHMRGSGAAAPA